MNCVLGVQLAEASQAGEGDALLDIDFISPAVLGSEVGEPFPAEPDAGRGRAGGCASS